MNAASCYWSYIDFYPLITYTSYITYLHLRFWRSRRSRIQKQPLEVFLKILQIHKKTPMLQSLFYKAASLQACNVTKKWLLHMCFSVKFEKFSRTPILKNIWTTVPVYWLLHHILIFTILYGIYFSFLQITSLLRNQNNRTKDAWGGFLWRSISLNEIFRLYHFALRPTPTDKKVTPTHTHPQQPIKSSYRPT